MTKLVQLDPNEIKIGWRIRADLGDMPALIASITELGQLQPVVVTQSDGQYEILAGLRRLKACKQLGIKLKAHVVSPASELQALDMQLHENSKRKDFDLMELGEGLKRRKRLYEREHPETKHGAAGKNRPKDDVADGDDAAPRFTLTAAETLQFSERKVQELLQMADLSKEDKDRIKQAKSSEERNRLTRDMLRKIRLDNKLVKLRDQARKLKEQEVEAKAAAAADNTVESPDGPEPEFEPEATIHLHHMDCMAMMSAQQPDSFHLVCTDPPYDRKRSLISHIARANINNEVEWDKLDIGWVLQAGKVIIQGGHLLAFCPIEAVGAYELACQAAGLTYRMTLIWHKTNPGTAHRPTYIHSVEAIVWATKGDKYYFKPWSNAGAPEAHNLIQGPICVGGERLDHPTQKPLWLMERLMKQHVPMNIEARVLDPFAGTGTTLVAAKKLGLRAVGSELEKEYIDMARLRLEATA